MKKYSKKMKHFFRNKKQCITGSKKKLSWKGGACDSLHKSSEISMCSERGRCPLTILKVKLLFAGESACWIMLLLKQKFTSEKTDLSTLYTIYLNTFALFKY